MPTREFTADPKKPVEFEPAELAHLEAMTAEAIEAGARADPNNPPLTSDALERMASARLVREVRRSTGLSQASFAARFKINHARLRDLERGRSKADSALTAYLKVIAAAPRTVISALENHAA
jgi:putative transcriptional regulator